MTRLFHRNLERRRSRRSSWLQSFAGDRSGVSAIEFALITPLAIALLFGEFVMGEAIAINRKVVITGHSVADLVAQNSTVTLTQVTDILNASTQIAAPFQTSNMAITLAELTTDASNRTTVTWAQALNATPPSVGSVFTLPNGLAQANTSLIYASVTYSYSPPIGSSLFPTLPFSYSYYINPRISSSIPLTN